MITANPDAWVDLGDGQAIAGRRVGKLGVSPPWPPNVFETSDMHRVFLDQMTWTVHVVDSRDHVRYVIGYHWSEDGARAQARRVVAAMLADVGRV